MILSTDYQNIQKHIAISSCNELSEFMIPKLRKHGITFFHYNKYYSNGELIRLSTHLEWTEHFFKKNYINGFNISESYLSKEINYFIWLMDDWPEMLNDAATNFNISNGITIAIKHIDSIECFGYSSNRCNVSIINQFYLNNLDLLLNYGYSFKVQAKTLIENHEKSKIIPAGTQSHHKEINSEKLSKRQFACANLLLKGMNYREMANHLNLSSRTIETHIESLKTKLKCRNKAELILTLANYNHKAL
jgi:DNA-binding CsgD family transcriptional regulator